jgi:hypothetical protein
MHPSELTEYLWARRDTADTEANAGLTAMATALEDYELDTDPGTLSGLGCRLPCGLTTPTPAPMAAPPCDTAQRVFVPPPL